MGKMTLKEVEENLREMDMESALERLYELERNQGLNLKKLIEKYIRMKTAVDAEKYRFDTMCKFEGKARLKGYKAIAGLDEAGRGPLAGPVVAASVILPEKVFIEKLNDSKQLTPLQRERLYDEISEKAIAYGVGIIDEKCIDEINILNATRKAMKLSVEALKVEPDLLLIDAEKLVDVKIDQIPIIKGDTLSISIAAASIIAKVTRDRMLDEMDLAYPQYGFSRHKGYGTAEHIQAIKKYGICPIHRISFTKHFV